MAHNRPAKVVFKDSKLVEGKVIDVNTSLNLNVDGTAGAAATGNKQHRMFFRVFLKINGFPIQQFVKADSAVGGGTGFTAPTDAKFNLSAATTHSIRVLSWQIKDNNTAVKPVKVSDVHSTRVRVRGKK
jgi:hypothetical protein